LAATQLGHPKLAVNLRYGDFIIGGHCSVVSVCQLLISASLRYAFFPFASCFLASTSTAPAQQCLSSLAVPELFLCKKLLNLSLYLCAWCVAIETSLEGFQ